MDALEMFGNETELDDCTKWNDMHNQSFFNTGIPDDRHLEWLEICIGPQRSVRKEDFFVI